MISVLLWCHSRQTMLNDHLPLWLGQREVDFEIVIGIGEGIIVPEHPKITITPTPDLKISKAYNRIMAASHGDVLLLSYMDMQVNNPYQLKNMLDNYSEMTMVTDKTFRNGKRNFGVYLDMMMVNKAQVQKAGGWCELYDSPDSYGYEDGDLVATLLENGLTFSFMETSDDKAVYHVNHAGPDVQNDPVIIKRIAKARETFFGRHKEGIMALYAKQLCGSGGRVVKI